MPACQDKKLVVLTSTLPRWKGDATTTFVLDHTIMLAPYFKDVYIIAPHAKSSKTIEKMAPNTTIKRVRYFLPTGQENIFYDGGAADKVSASPLYILKVGLYSIGVFWEILKNRPGNRMIINANWLIPQGLIAVMVKMVFRRTIIVTTARGADVYTMNGRLPRFLKKIVLQRSDAVVVNSEDLRKACRKIYKREYYKQPTGFDDKLFKPKRTSTYRKDKNNNFVIVSAGRLTEGKGFPIIVDALEKLKKEGLKVQLKIAGDGPDRLLLEEIIKKKGLQKEVEMLGWISAERIKEIYQKADLYVGAAKEAKNGWREAFGNVYTEAMACGTPVIVTTAAGASEVVENGVNGIVIKPDSYEEIVKNVKALYLDPKSLREMGLKAAESVRKFSKSAARDRYLSIFEKLNEAQK